MVLLVNLKKERLNRGLTQREIAKEAKVTQSTWARAERGMAVSAKNARRIAIYLDRNVVDVWDISEVAA